MRRRKVTPFSLSFLDIMFCGFGAVVLLVLILNMDTVDARNAAFADLRARVTQLENTAIVGREQVLELRNGVDATDRELTAIQGRFAGSTRELEGLQNSMRSMAGETAASRTRIEQLKSELKALDQRRVEAPAPDPRRGEQVHRFVGEGDRQYLTGLKMGGRHILILLDASASMLDETVVNVIRRRNMDDSRKRAAPKWRRAQAVAEWLIANLPPQSRFQVFTFNTAATATGDGRWMLATDSGAVSGTVAAVRATLPAGGTSLHNAFSVAAKLDPDPDNIILITDGLPTQGHSKPGGTTVSGKQRLRFFQQASKALPAGVPVNTILLPMEGDAHAAAVYWKLAIETRGSFLTPARDWP